MEECEALDQLRVSNQETEARCNSLEAELENAKNTIQMLEMDNQNLAASEKYSNQLLQDSNQQLDQCRAALESKDQQLAKMKRMTEHKYENARLQSEYQQLQDDYGALLKENEDANAYLHKILREMESLSRSLGLKNKQNEDMQMRIAQVKQELEEMTNANRDAQENCNRYKVELVNLMDTVNDLKEALG